MIVEALLVETAIDALLGNIDELLNFESTFKLVIVYKQAAVLAI